MTRTSQEVVLSCIGNRLPRVVEAAVAMSGSERIAWKDAWKGRSAGARRMVAVALIVASLSTFVGSAEAADGSTIFNSGLVAVSCTSASSCMAVGSYEDSTGPSTIYTLTEQWNGKRWRYVPSPTPANHNGGGLLVAVSCSGGSSCVAVGERLIFHQQKGEFTYGSLSEIWNGSTWRLVSVPSHSGETALLDAISCTTTTECIAVGSEGPQKRGDHATVAEQWDGKRWQIMPTPNVGTRGGEAADGASCPRARSCMAVGYDNYHQETGNELALAEQWDGNAWNQVKESSGYGALNGVSCSGPRSCIAVGVGLGGPPGPSPSTAAETWNGTSWTVERSPNPHHAVAAYLQAVSCAAPASCMATGYWYSKSFEGELTLAETWNGQTWALVTSRNPGSSSDELLGVACTSTTTCVAVGDDQGAASGSATLGEFWNGKAWKVVPTPEGPMSSSAF